MSWDLQAKITADGTGFARALNVAERQAQQFVHLVGEKNSEGLGLLKDKFAAAFSVEAIESAIHSTIQYAAHLKDVAEQEQLNTDQVQKLAIASKQIGLNDEFAAQALASFGKARKAMAEGRTAEALDLRKSLQQRTGIKEEDLQDSGKTNLDLAERLGEAYKNMVPNASDLEMIRELFPIKHGERMLAVLEHLHDLGANTVLIPPEQVNQLKHAEEVMSEFERRRTVGQADVLTHPFRSFFGLSMFGLLPGQMVPTSANGGHEPTAHAGSEFLGPKAPASMFKDESKDIERKKMEELRKQIAEAHLGTLTPMQKRAELHDRLEKIKKEQQDQELGFLPERFGDISLEESRARLQLEKEHALAGLHSMEHKHPMAHDSLAGIGGFTEQAGFGSSTAMPYLERIARGTEKTAENTRPEGRRGGRNP